MNPFFVTDFSVSDSLKTVRKSVLIYETIIVVDVTITAIKSFGAFAMLNQNTSGLIHISKIANRYINDVSMEFYVGEQCKAKILSISKSDKKISLSTIGFR